MIDWRTRVTVSGLAVSVRGTTSLLRENDVVTVLDLFYGALLPSGNDAAMQLAETVGEFLCDCWDCGP
jgi:D-alanyl-D-alanine carboxypeptidase (penicillin-binding protein 5/6)